ncbi:ANTAR domain-containing response regulator [Clostridium butyricum]|uniref:ANTAR domain-containing response regulator n=1 Tax=Clostridium butyricum TaxID=1492 RepID=UPI003F5C40C4
MHFVVRLDTGNSIKANYKINYTRRIKKLKQKVEKLEHTLEDRKLIEKAKGQLMSTSGLTENEAFRYMQKISMDSGRRMKDIASLILQELE